MRVVAWNVSRLAPWLARGGEFRSHVGDLGNPEVLCLQEIALRPQDTDLIEAMRGLVPGYRCEAALCDDPRNVTFRGGRAYGVATFVRDDLGAVTAMRPSWDREGRVVVVTLAAHELAVVNLYAVNGTPRPYYDPATGAKTGDRHAYKRRFQDQLLAMATELAADRDVVLAGDWNVSPTELDVTPRLRTEEPHATARSQLAASLAAGGWVDVYRAAHPDRAAYTWFGRTRTGRLDAARVDYIIVSPGLAPRVTSAEILADPRLRIGTDHAPIAVTISS